MKTTTSHFSDYNNPFSQGSIWRKWDLHIHSPLSFLNNQYPRLSNGEPDWEAFILRLEALDLAVIGITDYFTIDGYKKVREFKQQGRLANIQTILPNIEFRLNNIVSSRRDGQNPRRLNFHVIFSDDVSEQDIEEHFLHNIDFFYEGNPQDNDSKEKLKPSNIRRLGERLISQHQYFRDSGLSALEVGAKQTVVSHETISDCLNNSRFNEKYLLVFPEELSNLVDWDGQDHHTRKGLLQKSDMVFSSNLNTRNWCLGNNPYTEGTDNFIDEFKTLKPCIHGSDAHKIDEIGCPCAKRGTNSHRCSTNQEECELRYCWVKADPTFEGFKQLLYEPADRVLIQPQDPTPIKSNFTISRVEISSSNINEELSLFKTNIALNSNLVAVTGGKGSGKTAFVDLIANCYMDRCHSDDPNSFVRRIADQQPKVITLLAFKDQNSFTKDICANSFYESSQIIYIAQGELEKYIGEDSNLDIYVKNLIFESPTIRDTILNYEFDELNSVLDTIQSQIANTNGTILQLEESTSEHLSRSISLDKKQKEAELKDINDHLSELTKVQNDDKARLAQDKQRHLAKLKTEKDNLSNLKDLISQAIHFVERDIDLFNKNIELINEIQNKMGANVYFEKIAYRQHDELQKKLSSIKIELTEKVKGIENAQKEIESFESGIKSHAKLLDRKREIESGIINSENKIENIKQSKLALEQSRKNRRALLKQLVEAVISQKKKYDEIISVFSEQKVDVLSDLSFNATIHFSASDFIKSAEDIMDNRKVVLNPAEDGSILQPLFEIIKEILSNTDNNDAVARYADEIDNIAQNNLQRLKKSNAITPFDYYKFLYSNYFSILPTIRYKNTPLSKLSLGQKATVLIKIYLAQGDKPIIIDSHDDHLDNEFIMEELVKAIRQAKKFRQVILASNNGNVVINSDAEQIIIANRVDGKISYISGSIENPEIRDRSIKVLEGGSEAFRQRRLKYRLNK